MTIATSRPWQALGTYVELAVTEDAALPTAEALLRDAIDDLDRSCSRFRPDAELVRVNDVAGTPAAASELLRAAVTAALDAAWATDGLVDPTLGAELAAAGYDRDFALLRDMTEPLDAVIPGRRTPRWQAVEVDDAHGTVTIPRGCRLDLGATAKAFGADRAARRIADEVGGGVLVSLGGDIATAGPSPCGGWPIRVATNVDVPEESQTLLLHGASIATSSPDVHRWRRGHRSFHHILDPRTGQPAAPVWRAVTVVANSCLRANTLTTSAVVAGEAALPMLHGAGLPARLVHVDGSVVHCGGWPELEGG